MARKLLYCCSDRKGADGECLSLDDKFPDTELVPFKSIDTIIDENETNISKFSGFIRNATTHNLRLKISSQWVDKLIPSLLGNLTLGVSHHTDHLTRTSAHAPQGPRSRILSWAQQALTLMDCRASQLSY
ncbi:hypothetical protein TNCV_4344751 [Trichonephila clavipes]|nr:hypothetical protein TNCV_4344751 [Trichonephila clavipes]